MVEQDFEQFAMFLAGVAMSFDKTLHPEQIMLYFEVLKDEFEDIEDFKDAAHKVLKTWSYSYMPKPAHFIEAAMNKDQLEILALEAYNAAKRIAVEVGIYTDVEFDDPYIADTIRKRFGSFKEFAEEVAYTGSDDKWARRDFVKVYTALAKKGVAKGGKLEGYLSDGSQVAKIRCLYGPPPAKEPPRIEGKVIDLIPVKRMENA